MRTTFLALSVCIALAGCATERMASDEQLCALSVGPRDTIQDLDYKREINRRGIRCSKTGEKEPDMKDLVKLLNKALSEAQK